MFQNKIEDSGKEEVKKGEAKGEGWGKGRKGGARIDRERKREIEQKTFV